VSLFNVTKQKTKMTIIIILAILSAFLMLGISYVLFPDQNLQQPPPPLPTSKPESLLNEVLWTIQWIGLAAIIAITIVGAILLVGQVKTQKKQM
jgi:amino acid transporter